MFLEAFTVIMELQHYFSRDSNGINRAKEIPEMQQMQLIICLGEYSTYVF